MKKRRIVYYPTWQHGPMTYWVHTPADGQPWGKAQSFEPPAPNPIPGKGFPVFIVEFDRAVLGSPRWMSFGFASIRFRSASCRPT